MSQAPTQADGEQELTPLLSRKPKKMATKGTMMSPGHPEGEPPGTPGTPYPESRTKKYRS